MFVFFLFCFFKGGTNIYFNNSSFYSFVLFILFNVTANLMQEVLKKTLKVDRESGCSILEKKAFTLVVGFISHPPNSQNLVDPRIVG